MIRLLKFLFTGDWHLHKWKIIRIGDVYSIRDGKRPVCTKYYCQCEICGEIKQF